jgi:enoyl-CoA hydratase/carnithine racemase
MQAVLDFPKLLVAAVNGPAIGIGVTLLLHCDIVFCTDSATFAIPFFALALAPEYGSSKLLARAVVMRRCCVCLVSIAHMRLQGKSLANEMLFLRRNLSAPEALASSLVSRVLPQEDFLQKVLQSLQQALSLELAAPSISTFKSLTAPAPTRASTRELILEELAVIDQRFQDGHPRRAMLSSYGIMKSKL